MIVGGLYGDDIRGGDGNNLASATTRRLDYTTGTGILLLITPIANQFGGNDTIHSGAGQDVLIGGTGNDAIDGGANRDLIFGDNAVLDRRDASEQLHEPALPDPARRPDLRHRHRLLLAPNTTPQLDPTGAAWWNDFRDHAARSRLDHAGEPLRQRLPRGRRRRRHDLRRARQRHDPGRRLDRLRVGRQRGDVHDRRGIQAALPWAPSSAPAATPATTCCLNPSVDGAADGSDYIEGGGGNDVIFGDHGQDDIIGGSSNLFGLDDAGAAPRRLAT